MAIGRYSVPDLGIGNIFAIFQDLGNVEVVMEGFVLKFLDLSHLNPLRWI